MTPRTLPRRTVLAASGTAVLAAVAACSSDPAPPAGNPATSAAGSSTSASAGSGAAATSAATTSAATTSAAVAPSATAPALAVTTPTAGAAPTGTALASVADVEAAGSLVVGPEDAAILLTSANGTVVGHSAICTHQGCKIAASGTCPCHQSRFNITTGAVENGPALRPLPEVTVTVADGQVYAG